MGRKSKPVIQIQLPPRTEAMVVTSDALPPYVSFVDISNGRTDARKQLTRFYFTTPSQEEALAARSKGIRNVGGKSSMTGHASIGLCSYAAEKISEEFGREISCLTLLCLRGKFLATSTLQNILSSLKCLIDFLALTRKSRLRGLTIYDLEFDDWLSFKSYLEKTTLDIKAVFYASTNVFARFAPTCLEGALRSISPPKRSKLTPAKSDNPSSFVIEDEGYSDAVMYQLLAQFLYAVKRQIGYLKHYEELSPEALGEDWIEPQEKIIRTAENKRSKRSLKSEQLLADEANYQKILDNRLVWYKLGFRDKAGLISRIRSYCRKNPSMGEILDAYAAWERSTHSLTASNGGANVFGLYVKRPIEEDSTGSKGQLAFALINIVLIYTGNNKEVVLSWPSRIDGKSILEHFDTLFVKTESDPVEVEIPGVKIRTGALSKDKIIHTPIVVKSPLYEMLHDYERYAKTNFDGPFFELLPTVVNSWGAQMGARYVVYDDKRQLLKTLETKRFRKVSDTVSLLRAYGDPELWPKGGHEISDGTLC